MMIFEYHISPAEIIIQQAMIARLLGVETDVIPEPFASVIKQEMEYVPGYDQIKGGIRIVEKPKIHPSTNEIVLEDERFCVGKQVIGYLKNSERMALFVCTAGEGISQRSKSLMNSGMMLEGYVSDIIGSLLVEEAMSIIHDDFRMKMDKEGLKTTNRYCPGYCDWDVSEQQKLFRFFPPDFCGIKLSESSLMHPVKSVSGIIGVGKNVRFHKYVCNACSNMDCIYRNLKYTV